MASKTFKVPKPSRETMAKLLYETPPDRFPAFPPRDDMQNTLYLDEPDHQGALRRHFGSLATTIVLSEAPVGWTTRQRQGLRIPDLTIAFNVRRATIIDRQGYAIEAQGKPPDFVLEIASPTTARNDYTQKRIDYACFEIPEYWRFDASGGEYYDAALAGDKLVDGVYEPVDVTQVDEQRYWGHVQVLGLDICWEEGQIRWYDPAAQRYLLTSDEADEARLAAERGRDAAERREATAQREWDAALERIRELEAENQRLRDL